MWLNVGFYIVWGIVKGFFGSLLSLWRQKKEVDDAVEPYKKEQAIKAKPAGSYRDTIDGL